MEHATTDKSTQVEGVSGLLKLPREVRDMIYNYAWNDTGAIDQRYKSRTYKISYRTSLWDTARHVRAQRGNAKWLLANKQILYEGLMQLLREATWHISTPKASFARRVRHSKISGVTKHLLPKLEPSEARVVYLDAQDNRHELHRIFPYHFFRNKYRDGNTPNSRLETVVLELATDLRRTIYLRGPGSVSFDLSLLGQLAAYSQLKKFCVHVRIEGFLPFRMNPLGDYIAGLDKWMQELATALSEVGQLIIKGGHETTTDLSDYYEKLSEVYKKRISMPESAWIYTIERS